MTGIETADLANGGRYLRIHYSADASKNPATPAGALWYAKNAPPATPVREWLREMEMAEDVYDGEPVFADYRDKWHCISVDQPLPIVKNSLYFGGWDCGMTNTPAFVLLQVTPQPWQVHALLEVISPGAEPMEKFAPRVLFALQKRLPGRWDEVEHWGDATVVTMNGANGETAQQAAARHGIKIRRASNEWAGRYGAVTWLLNDEIDEETSRFQIDGHYCPHLREGFKGAYRFDDSPAGEAIGPGRILKDKPRKDGYSHIQDAFQYGAARIKRLFRNGKFNFVRE